MINQPSSIIIDSIYKNQSKIYSFGCGYIYECFQILHGYRIDGIIHSNPDSIRNNFPQNIEIITPIEFVEKNYQNCIVIIYTLSYKKEAEFFCKKNSINYLTYDDPAHLSGIRISKISNALQFLSSSSLISEYNVKKFSKISLS